MFLLFHYKYINVSNIGLVMKHTRFEILRLEHKIILIRTEQSRKP